MKQFYLILLLFSVYEPILVQASEIEITEQTFLVYKRYYYIARLSKTIDMLAKVYYEVNNMQAVLAGRPVDFKLLLPSSECQAFRHKLVRSSVECIHKSHNLKPLFMVWDSFKAYKFLEDELLIDDFSKEIFIITRNTLHHLNVLALDESMVRYMTGEKMLSELERMTYHIEQLLNGEPAPAVRADLNDLAVAVNLDTIASRYYCIKRINHVVAYLLRKTDSHLATQIYNKYFSLRQDQLDDGLKSLEQWWSDIQQYKYLTNEEQVRTFLCYIVLLAYSHAPYLYKGNNHAQMYAIYQQIAALPIEELLTTIDALAFNFQQMQQSYTQSGLSFMEWAKNYWWVPPIVFSTILLKVLKHYLIIWNKKA